MLVNEVVTEIQPGGPWLYHAEVRIVLPNGKTRRCGTERPTEIDPRVDADELFHMREMAQWFFEVNPQHVPDATQLEYGGV